MGRAYKDIKYDFWYNLAKIGISTGDIAFAIKGNPGTKIFDHSKNPSFFTNVGGGGYQHDYLVFNADAGNDDYVIGLPVMSPPFTILGEFSIDQNSGQGMLWGQNNGTNFDYHLLGIKNFFGDGYQDVHAWVRRGSLGEAIATFPRQPYGTKIGIAAVFTTSYQSIYAYVGKKFYSVTNSTPLSPNGINDARLLSYPGIQGPSPATVGAVVGVNGVLTAKQINDFLVAGKQIWTPRPVISYFDQDTTILPILFPVQSQTIDNIDIIQQHTLNINPLNQAQEIDNIDPIQANILIINQTDQPQAIDNMVLSTGITLQVPGSTQPQTIDDIEIVQQNSLNVDPIDQPQSINNIILSTDVVLQIAKTIQAQNIDEITLIPQFELSIDGNEQGQPLDNITLESGIILGIADIIQNQGIDDIILSQQNTLPIDGLIQGQLIDTVVFSITEGRIFITITLKEQPSIDLNLN